ncbi:SCP-2 sterol transfer family protein [Jatrophihabitans endophyticus]|uniref:SCP-2 sterol transfer family protein n=1 Tax=Jatrophihabitans endophyticus TaxID=1206085 RepID=A0A1M5MP31_9ACTN|nr:SCP2 sterol-binding domain-containing protein [Jatrophihabitans endophyticus]SHG79031.1 SCP-2 sterol transfer family protein [Jatrophihabitans endophyticus]
MATVEECEDALHRLATRLSDNGEAAPRQARVRRTLSCTVRDLGVVFTGLLDDGKLTGIARASDPQAQVRLELGSDDLLELVDGSLRIGPALATGRVKVGAGVRDLLLLRSLL